MEFVQRLIDRWISHDLRCPPGVSPADIDEFESRYGVQLPSDLRGYFLAVNGMGPEGEYDHDFFSFWQFSDIRTIAEELPDRADRFPDSRQYFLFGDHSIWCPAFAIRLSANRPQPNLIAHVYCDGDMLEVEPAFSSFTVFVQAYLRDPLDAIVASIADT